MCDISPGAIPRRAPRASPRLAQSRTVDRGWGQLPDGARLAYQVEGPDGAPPLLLLQGQANSHRWWDGLREPFASTYRTVTFDYRGTGDSRAPVPAAGRGAEWSTASFAADALAVLDHLGHHRVRVYATSMGGRVAQVLASSAPSRVVRLVLACTSPGGPHARERGPEVRRALAQPDPDARRRALLDLMYTPAWAAAHGDSSTLLGDPTMTPEAARQHLRVSGRHDAWAALPAISAPTLVLHGSDDLMTPAGNADLLADRIPDARARVTPGGRHGFFDEFASTVTPEVLAFLD
jgi:3-oxoadipate enol-lactonase